METPELTTQQHRQRLAEMVWHLTDCEPLQALAAVDPPAGGGHLDPDTALELVARGICRVQPLRPRRMVDLRDAAPAPEITTTG